MGKWITKRTSLLSHLIGCIVCKSHNSNGALLIVFICCCHQLSSSTVSEPADVLIYHLYEDVIRVPLGAQIPPDSNNETPLSMQEDVSRPVRRLGRSRDSFTLARCSECPSDQRKIFSWHTTVACRNYSRPHGRCAPPPPRAAHCRGNKIHIFASVLRVGNIRLSTFGLSRCEVRHRRGFYLALEGEIFTSARLFCLS
jgi:hypothetical protein